MRLETSLLRSFYQKISYPVRGVFSCISAGGVSMMMLGAIKDNNIAINESNFEFILFFLDYECSVGIRIIPGKVK